MYMPVSLISTHSLCCRGAPSRQGSPLYMLREYGSLPRGSLRNHTASRALSASTGVYTEAHAPPKVSEPSFTIPLQGADGGYSQVGHIVSSGRPQ